MPTEIIRGVNICSIGLSSYIRTVHRTQSFYLMPFPSQETDILYFHNLWEKCCKTFSVSERFQKL